MTTTTTDKFTQVFTQINENYGAHDWDGKGECSQYWKSKGGTTYVLESGVDVDAFIKAIESEDEYFTENVVHQNVVEDPYEDVESWDPPTFVTSAHAGFFLDLTQTGENSSINPKIAVKKTVTCLSFKGDFNHLETVYTTVDGEMLSSSNIEAWLKANPSR
tara:strand:- start:24357 stop:24839 length:483 start_codon:yes stop_codon:yes gene_type:complete